MGLISAERIQGPSDSGKGGNAMLGYIWLGMILLSVICALFTGRLGQLSGAVLDGADKAVSLSIAMAGSMCLWTGMMKIAERGGLTNVIARMLSPLLRRLMPDYRNDRQAMCAVSANVTANILGLGNAATPLGIAAMKAMQKNNPLRSSPNNSMIMFVVINTASVQLIPTTIAAMRQAAGSIQPYSIVPYVWVVSAVSLILGVTAAKILSVRS